MPIYEYQCTLCHHHFDLMQKISDAPIKTCPKCGKNSVIKLVSAAGFQLKGTGWYATDFKGKPSASETPANKEDSSKTSDSDASSTDSKKGDNT